jgi:DMSO/TMAO reductase YedYZ molybdopterin-dependent catalytic subunit
MVRQPGPALTPAAFPSPLRGSRLTSQLGVLLAAAFGICFLTGVLSHLIQHPPGWFTWPARPVWLYRVTQGVHVTTGLATVPLLGAKLWSVYPRLFRRPPLRGVADAADRAAVGLLVATALFEIVTGVLNVSLWYAPMPFFFPAAHHWAGWLVVGALLVHVGVRLPTIRAALARRAAPADGAAPPAGLPAAAARRAALGRRQLLGGVAAASGLVVAATVGQTVPALAPLSPLAPRRPGTGPQGLPVNRSARAAGVTAAEVGPAYRLDLRGPGGRRALDLAGLAALPQHTAALPIACVEGWSATGRWTGVRLRDLAALVGADPNGAEALVESLQRAGRYRAAVVPPVHLRDPSTLLALLLDGEPLHLDHGFPVRLIAPNRPGVLQTKWVGRITVREAR